jgi:hypothetical protein
VATYICNLIMFRRRCDAVWYGGKLTDVLGWLGAFLYPEYGELKFLRNIDKFWLLRTALDYLRAGNLLHGWMSIYCNSELAGEGYRPSSSLSSSVLPIPMAAQTNAWVCDRWLVGIAVSNLAELWMSVSCDCCVLSVTDLCDWTITRPEESYWLCVCVCVTERDQLQQEPSTPTMSG